MAKNIHFCTLDKLYEIMYPNMNKYVRIKTFRTGYVPSLYPNDPVRMNYRNKQKKDKYLRMGIVEAVVPIKYHEIPKHWRAEIKSSYKSRKFDDEHWFFCIIIRKRDMPVYNYEYKEVHEKVMSNA